MINIAPVETKCSQWLPEAVELLWDASRNILEHFMELCPTKSISESLSDCDFSVFSYFLNRILKYDIGEDTFTTLFG